MSLNHYTDWQERRCWQEADNRDVSLMVWNRWCQDRCVCAARGRGSEKTTIQRPGPVISNNLFTTPSTTLTPNPSVQPATLLWPWTASLLIRVFIRASQQTPYCSFSSFLLISCSFFPPLVVSLVSADSRQGLFNIMAFLSFYYQRCCQYLLHSSPALCMDTLSSALVAQLSMSLGQTLKCIYRICGLILPQLCPQQA